MDRLRPLFVAGNALFPHVGAPVALISLVTCSICDFKPARDPLENAGEKMLMIKESLSKTAGPSNQPLTPAAILILKEN